MNMLIQMLLKIYLYMYTFDLNKLEFYPINSAISNISLTPKKRRIVSN